jgi:hypothetical protein
MKAIIDVNSDVLDGIKLGEVEELWYKSADGWDIQGWLIKPADYEPGRKYPLLLWIHGGPWAMYNVAFNWEWQNFAANGYAVLFTNPRGSTGYGQNFVNGIQYSYPGKDYDDLMAGVDAALAKGSRALQEEAYARTAQKAADFILQRMCTAHGRLHRRYRHGHIAYPGFLDDYAFMIEACVVLYQATFQEAWLTMARRLTEKVVEQFHDPQDCLFNYSPDPGSLPGPVKKICF